MQYASWTPMKRISGWWSNGRFLRIGAVTVALGAALATTAQGCSGPVSEDSTKTSAPGSDAEAGDRDFDGGTAGPTASGAFGRDGAIIAVHAAANLPPFRLCFPDGDHGARVPMPDNKIMPRSNVVGVDVGNAVHVGALSDGRAGSDAGVDAGRDGGDAGTAPSASTLGPIYVLSEATIREFYKVNDEARWPSCEVMVRSLLADGALGKSLWAPQFSTDDAQRLLTPIGGHLLVIDGDGAPDAGPTGLRARVIDFAAGETGTFQPLNLAYPLTALQLGYRPVTGNELPPFSTGDGFELQPAVSIPLPETEDGYATAGFHVRFGGKASGFISLAQIQEQSDPTTVPAAFYRLPSSFLLITLGSVNAPEVKEGEAFPQVRLIVVPVRDADLLRDAGSDAATNP